MKALSHIVVLSIAILSGCCATHCKVGERMADSETGKKWLESVVVNGVNFNTAYPMRFLEGLQEQLDKHTEKTGKRPFYIVCTPAVLGYFAELEEAYKKNPAPPGDFDFDKAPANVLVRYFDEHMDELGVEFRSDMILVTRKPKKQKVEQEGRPEGLP